MLQHFLAAQVGSGVHAGLVVDRDATKEKGDG